MKKIISTLLCVTLLSSLSVGCIKKVDTNDSSIKTENTPSSSKPALAQSEKYEVGKGGYVVYDKVKGLTFELPKQAEPSKAENSTTHFLNKSPENVALLFFSDSPNEKTPESALTDKTWQQTMLSILLGLSADKDYKLIANEDIKLSGKRATKIHYTSTIGTRNFNTFTTIVQTGNTLHLISLVTASNDFESYLKEYNHCIDTIKFTK